MNKQIAISAKHLKKAFGKGESIQVIYSDLDIDIYKGDFTVIMGSSGAGKSTLMYSLSGMDKPDGGEIYFDGTDITKLNNDKLAVFRRKECGFVFQQIYLIDKMNLMDNVITAGVLTSKDREDIKNRARELFSLVNIPEKTWRKTSAQISGGEAQRAGIVRAVINNPNVLFADEPTGALNRASSDEVMEELVKLNSEGTTIMLVTHDVKVAAKCTRVMYIVDGNIKGEYDLSDCSTQIRERERALNNWLLELGW